MAIKSSSQGSISFSEIKKEFGDSNGNTAGVSLGKYRVSQTYGEMSNMPLDEGIPQSGAIAMSNFYGKRLNIVVNFYNWPNSNNGSGGQSSANTEAASGNIRVSRATGRYIQNNGSECVGEFKNPPKLSNGTPKTSGSKVWLHINKTLGGAGHPQNSEKYCTFRTGNWQSNTDLRIHLGNEGKVYGRGGEGGVGGDGKSDPGESGSRGTSAIGVEYEGTTIITSNPGAIAAGGGGGGGGGGAGRQEDRGNDRSAGGGGGGGGAGLPGGNPGAGGRDGEGRFSGGDGGGPGTTTAGGKEGDGGDNAGEAKGGDGGEGGNLGQSGESGRRGSGDDGTGDGGEGGSGGEWLRTEGNTVQYGGFQGQTFGGPVSGDVS